MSQSRRDFIKTVILSTGAVFASWNDLYSSPASKADPSVTTSSLHYGKAHEYLRDKMALPSFPYHAETVETLVIGGGAAGMAAAWKLKKAGKDVLLLENEPALGGVMLNPVPSWKGIQYPLGSTYFYRYNKTFKEFYDDIGVHPIETGEDALYVSKDETDETIVDWWNPGAISQLPFPQKDRDAFRQFRDMLFAMPIPTYPVSTMPLDTVKEYDSLSAAEFVGRFGSRILTDTMDLYARSVLGAPLEEVNAYSFLNFYSLEFGDAYQIPCYTFAGGLGEIANKASGYLGSDHIRTNALVLNVRNEKGKVALNYIDTQTGATHTVQAENAIIAVQKNIARHLVPEIPTAQANAMGEVRYAPYITIALCCNAPLFDKRAFDFWISDKRRRFTDLIDVTSSSDAASGKGNRLAGDFVYMLSACQPESARKYLEDDRWLAEFAQKTAKAVAEHVPHAMEKIEEMHVFAWGHSMVIPAVGSHRELSSLISQPVGNIHFANADNDLAPSVENASYWGFETAKRCGG